MKFKGITMFPQKMSFKSKASGDLQLLATYVYVYLKCSEKILILDMQSKCIHCTNVE